jgi:two-component system cell cycle response regulator CpdR
MTSRCGSSRGAMQSQASAEAAVARILIAEDEEPVRMLIARALVEDGHSVTATADGAEALDALQREDGGFDLLLADIKMPVMDGIALSLAVARDFPRLPILLMTGYADQRERAAGLEAMISDVIAKPFAVAEIKFAVASALAKGNRRP